MFGTSVVDCLRWLCMTCKQSQPLLLMPLATKYKIRVLDCFPLQGIAPLHWVCKGAPYASANSSKSTSLCNQVVTRSHVKIFTEERPLCSALLLSFCSLRSCTNRCLLMPLHPSFFAWRHRCRHGLANSSCGRQERLHEDERAVSNS